MVATAAQESVVEQGQRVVPGPIAPGAPHTSLADGHPDFRVSGSRDNRKANAWSVVPTRCEREDPIPFQPWARRSASDSPPRPSSSSQRQRHSAVGTPGHFRTKLRAPDREKPGLFVHLIENNDRWNAVYIDGRPHKPKEELEPLFYGDQTARWEGDTLVIATISIDTRAQIRDGWFHSEDLHVIERLRRPSMNYLEYQFFGVAGLICLGRCSCHNERRVGLCTNNETSSRSGSCRVQSFRVRAIARARALVAALLTIAARIAIGSASRPS